AELRLAFGGQLVVLARRTGVRFLPLVVDESLAAHLAEQRVERAFLGREVRLAEAHQHVGDVDLVAGDDLQDQELEQPLLDRAELLFDAHSDVKLPCLNKVAGRAKPVKGGPDVKKRKVKREKRKGEVKRERKVEERRSRRASPFARAARLLGAAG